MCQLLSFLSHFCIFLATVSPSPAGLILDNTSIGVLPMRVCRYSDTNPPLTMDKCEAIFSKILKAPRAHLQDPWTRSKLPFTQSTESCYLRIAVDSSAGRNPTDFFSLVDVVNAAKRLIRYCSTTEAKHDFDQGSQSVGKRNLFEVVVATTPIVRMDATNSHNTSLISTD